MAKSFGSLSDEAIKRTTAPLKMAQSKLFMPPSTKDFHVHRSISVLKEPPTPMAFPTLASATMAQTQSGINLPLLGHHCILPAYDISEANFYTVATELGAMLTQQLGSRMIPAIRNDAPSSQSLKNGASELGSLMTNHARAITNIILRNIKRGRTLLYTLHPLRLVDEPFKDRIYFESVVSTCVTGVSYDYGLALASAFDEMALDIPWVVNTSDDLSGSTLSITKKQNALNGPAIFSTQMLNRDEVKDLAPALSTFIHGSSFEGVVRKLIYDYLGGCMWSILSGEHKEEILPLSLCPTVMVMVDVHRTNCAFLVSGLMSLSVHATDGLSRPLKTGQVTYTQNGLNNTYLPTVLTVNRDVKDSWTGTPAAIYDYDGMILSILGRRMNTDSKSRPCYYTPAPAIED
jgi:hypothetical protein